MFLAGIWSVLDGVVASSLRRAVGFRICRTPFFPIKVLNRFARSHSSWYPTRSIGEIREDIDQRRMKAIGLRTKIPARFLHWSFPER